MYNGKQSAQPPIFGTGFSLPAPKMVTGGMVYEILLPTKKCFELGLVHGDTPRFLSQPSRDRYRNHAGGTVTDSCRASVRPLERLDTVREAPELVVQMGPL